MKYLMIASDYDGTLLSPTRRISEYTKQTIERYVAAGGLFVLCSGRMFFSIKNEAQVLGLHGVAICYQGALIKDMDSGKVYDITPINPDLAVEYVEFMKSQGATPQVYIDDTLTIEKENPMTDVYASYCRVKPNVVGNFSTYLSNIDGQINKVYCHTKLENTERIREMAREKFRGRLNVSSSGALNVEAVNVNAAKGVALKKFAAMHGIDTSEVMAFGDNLNDIDLLQAAGFGVAVGDAVDAVKIIADYVTDNCADDGVAKAIDKFCLQR